MTEERTCRVCGETKSIECFYQYKGRHRRKTCKKCCSAKTQAWRKLNPLRSRMASRKWKNGIGRFGTSIHQSRSLAKRYGYMPCMATVEELEIAFTGECHVCGISEAECKRKLHMDHNHETGKFRGWLCAKCNIALGLLGDSEEGVRSLLEYINDKE